MYKITVMDVFTLIFPKKTVMSSPSGTKSNKYPINFKHFKSNLFFLGKSLKLGVGIAIGCLELPLSQDNGFDLKINEKKL